MLRLRSFILLVVVVAAGCAGGSGDSTFLLEWGLVYVGDDAQRNISCDEAGTPNVDLDVQNIDTNAVFHDRFACGPMYGKGQRLPAGTYVASVRLRDDVDEIVYEQEPVTAPIYRHESTRLDLVVFQVQSFELAWSLARNGTGIHCEDTAGVSVELIAQLGSRDKVTYSWPCTDYGGSTVAIPPGNYSLQVRLVDRNGTELSGTGAMTFPVNRTSRAVLPPVTFDVN